MLSDEIVVRITAEPGATFLDRMIALVEGADRQKTPNEIALSILLAGLTIIFLLAVVTLQPFAIYSDAEQPIIVLVALLVCLIPTTIGGLLSAIGIAGMDRLVQRNVLAMSGRAVEAAGDVTTLLLDKTGTITFGARQAAELLPVHDVTERRAGRGRTRLEPRRRDTGGALDRRVRHGQPTASSSHAARDAVLVPFTAQTRMSGMDFPAVDGMPARSIRKGAAESVRRMVADAGGDVPLELGPLVDGVSTDGATPLVVTDQRGERAAAHPRRDPAQGHGQAGHDRALRPAAGDGHPHGDDHRRQRPDRGGDRPARPASTTSSPRPRPRTRWR